MTQQAVHSGASKMAGGTIESWITCGVAAVQLALLGACSGNTITDSCGVAGRERSCDACATQQVGIQTCQLNGSWSVCECYVLGHPAAPSVVTNTGATASRTSGVQAEADGVGAAGQAGHGGDSGHGGAADEAANGGRGGHSAEDWFFSFPFAGRRGPFPGRR